MTHRGTILEKAHEHTVGEREAEYGSPRKNLTDTARMWTAYLTGRYGISIPLTAEDVAQFNVMQKISRTFSGRASDDTFEDEAAYAAIAGELSSPDLRSPFEELSDYVAPQQEKGENE